MGEFRTAREALDKCESKGQLLPLAEIDLGIIRSIVALAAGDKQAGEKLASGLGKDDVLWNNVFNSYYDSLHKLADVVARFDKVNPASHLCLFAYICKRHPELEFDWGFFEKIRTKRNGAQYYGQKATKEDWDGVEAQMKLYIHTLESEVKRRLHSIDT